ncbi:hypothetical protein BSLG_002850 [Batrachochytrium salamandrivorans]|nr:hypothetical protein BSLG_006248 [Batrachochytrium salamandrivorans]KAJ1342753.1 hypothetical protein BSLG_002850 [Batrachochytrium salamandrivorans]
MCNPTLPNTIASSLIVLVSGVHASSTLVMPSFKLFGLGWAFITSLFLLAAFALVALATSQHRHSGSILMALTAAWTLYVLVLGASAKIPVGSPWPVQDYVSLSFP